MFAKSFVQEKVTNPNLIISKGKRVSKKGACHIHNYAVVEACMHDLSNSVPSVLKPQTTIVSLKLHCQLRALPSPMTSYNAAVSSHSRSNSFRTAVHHFITAVSN